MSQKEMRLLDYESSKPLANQSVNIVSDDVVKAINAAHGVATMAAMNMVKFGMECGRLLAEVRDRIPHGQWGKWLSVNVPGLGDRTERVYRQMYANRELIESSPDPILTISDATRFLADTNSNRQDNAEMEPDEGQYLPFMEEVESQVNSMLSEIAADHERVNAMLADMRPTGLVVDAIETREVSSVVDPEDEPYVLESLKDDWKRLTKRYDSMALPWITRAKIATILERIVTTYSVGVFRDDCTRDELDEYDEWAQEGDER